MTQGKSDHAAVMPYWCNRYHKICCKASQLTSLLSSKGGGNFRPLPMSDRCLVRRTNPLPWLKTCAAWRGSCSSHNWHFVIEVRRYLVNFVSYSFMLRMLCKLFRRKLARKRSWVRSSYARRISTRDQPKSGQKVIPYLHSQYYTVFKRSWIFVQFINSHKSFLKSVINDLFTSFYMPLWRLIFQMFYGVITHAYYQYSK